MGSKERGISVNDLVADNFESGSHVFNLLDAPGHEDFSEDFVSRAFYRRRRRRGELLGGQNVGRGP